MKNNQCMVVQGSVSTIHYFSLIISSIYRGSVGYVGYMRIAHMRTRTRTRTRIKNISFTLHTLHLIKIYNITARLCSASPMHYHTRPMHRPGAQP